MGSSAFIESLIDFYWNNIDAPTVLDPVIVIAPAAQVGTTSAIARFANRHHDHHIWAVVELSNQKRDLQRICPTYQRKDSLVRLMGASEVKNAIIGLLLPPEMIILDSGPTTFQITDMLRATPCLSETKLLVFR